MRRDSGTLVSGCGLRLIKMDDAEHEAAGLCVLAVLVLPGIAFTRRWLDGEYGEVSAPQVVLTDPGSHGDDHGAQVVGARFGAFVDSRTLDVLICVQARLETWKADAGPIGLAGARGRAWQYASHDYPLSFTGEGNTGRPYLVLPAGHLRTGPGCSGDKSVQEPDGRCAGWNACEDCLGQVADREEGQDRSGYPNHQATQQNYCVTYSQRCPT